MVVGALLRSSRDWTEEIDRGTYRCMNQPRTHLSSPRKPRQTYGPPLHDRGQKRCPSEGCGQGGRAAVLPCSPLPGQAPGLLGSWAAAGTKVAQELRSALHRLPRPNPAPGSDLPGRDFLPPPLRASRLWPPLLPFLAPAVPSSGPRTPFSPLEGPEPSSAGGQLGPAATGCPAPPLPLLHGAHRIGKSIYFIGGDTDEEWVARPQDPTALSWQSSSSFCPSLALGEAP